MADGTHTIQVSVKDATNLTSSSAVLHETVDNTSPTAVMYQPTREPSRTNGPTTFQVHASDALRRQVGAVHRRTGSRWVRS